MKTLHIPESSLQPSNIIMGCMRINNLSLSEIETLVRSAMEAGVNMFDHADIYGGGECEELFAKALHMDSALREKMILQSKCGIRSGFYDFSKEHILRSVDGILQRLHTDYLDVLLLHRPDALMEPEETAEALQTLFDAGKVRYFGVSNQNPAQIELVDSGMAVNMNIDQSIDRTGSTLEYCRLHHITIQAWSPFQKGFFGGPFLGDMEQYPELNRMCEELAEKYSVTPTGIAVAWLTRHPANIQVILGTTKVSRMLEGCAGSQIPLTREEWYGLYKAAGNMVP